MSDLENQIQEISVEGQQLTTTLKSLIFEIHEMKVLPPHFKRTANSYIDDAAGELLQYNHFFSELPTFLVEALKLKDKIHASTLLFQFGIDKGIHKIWHPSHIPKISFETDMLISLRSIYLAYIENLKKLLELYKEKVALPEEEWLQPYKKQLGETVSMRLAVFNQDLPCMEAEINSLEHILKTFAITPSKPANKATTTATNGIKHYTMNGSFSNYKSVLDTKYDVINLLTLSFRSAICDAQFNDKNRSAELEYYNFDNFMAFIKYLTDKGLLKEPLLQPFQDRTFVENFIKEVYGVNTANDFFTDMPPTELCHDILKKIRKLKYNNENKNATEGGARKKTKRSKKQRRKTRRHRKN